MMNFWIEIFFFKFLKKYDFITLTKTWSKIWKLFYIFPLIHLRNLDIATKLIKVKLEKKDQFYKIMCLQFWF